MTCFEKIQLTGNFNFLMTLITTQNIINTFNRPNWFLSFPFFIHISFFDDNNWKGCRKENFLILNIADAEDGKGKKRWRKIEEVLALVKLCIHLISEKAMCYFFSRVWKFHRIVFFIKLIKSFRICRFLCLLVRNSIKPWVLTKQAEDDRVSTIFCLKSQF